MAIEIRELIIKGVVGEQNVLTNRPEDAIIKKEDLQKLRKDIIEDCMEKMEKLLERKNRR